MYICLAGNFLPAYDLLAMKDIDFAERGENENWFPIGPCHDSSHITLLNIPQEQYYLLSILYDGHMGYSSTSNPFPIVKVPDTFSRLVWRSPFPRLEWCVGQQLLPTQIDISIYFKDISLKLGGRKMRKSIIAINFPNSWQNNSPDANWTHYP